MKAGPNSQSDWWCVDSGASQHMSSMRDKMTEFNQFKRRVKLFMGDNSMLPGLEKGNIDVDIYLDSEQSTVTLTDVLYAPQLKQNPLSIKAAFAKG